MNISWHDRKVRLDFVYFTHVGQVIYLCFFTLDRPEEVTKSLGRRTPADRVQGTITLTITIIEPSNNSGNYSEMAWTQMYVSSCLKIPIQIFYPRISRWANFHNNGMETAFMKRQADFQFKNVVLNYHDRNMQTKL